MTKPKRPQQQYLSRVLHYKLHRRSLLAVFVLLMVLFASIGFLLYSEFSNYANSQTASYATDLMAQQVNSTQNLWEEMDALSSSIQADQNISAFFYRPEERPADQLPRLPLAGPVQGAAPVHSEYFLI